MMVCMHAILSSVWSLAILISPFPRQIDQSLHLHYYYSMSFFHFSDTKPPHFQTLHVDSSNFNIFPPLSTTCNVLVSGEVSLCFQYDE